MFKRSQLTSRKYAKRKYLLLRIKILFFVFVSLVLIVLLSYLSRLGNVTIADITVQGNYVISTLEIKSLVESELQGNYYWLFPRENIFIFPKRTILAKIKDTWKRIDTVAIERSSLTALAIIVTEKKAKFLWCSTETAEASDASQCFFIDEEGYLFSRAPLFSDNVYFRFFGNINTPDPVGQKYLPTPDFQNLSNFILGLEKLRIEPSKLIAKIHGEYELYLADRSRILFNDRQGFSITLDNLSTFLASDPFREDVKKSSTTVDYVDARFGNKIYYKFK